MAGARKVLIFPCSNTFSHVAQALAVAGRLEDAGIECHLGLASPRLAWAARVFPRCHETAELWVPSGVPFPCLRWFSDREHAERCLASQEQLVQRLRPGLVISIFDFLSRASGRGRPVISINGACMLPGFPGVLGCDDADTPNRRQQQHTLDRFWEFAARALAPPLLRRGLPAPARANELLLADANLIYEMAELCGVSQLPPNGHAIGPITWPGWERLGDIPPLGRAAGDPIVYLNSGTLAAHAATFERLLDEIRKLGVRLLVSTGHGGASRTDQRLFCRPLLAPAHATALADLVVCAGGIGVCYQNLASQTPSLVVPMQPEQATNGLHLQRHGCGRVLLPAVVFRGGAHEYAQAVDYERVRTAVRELLEQHARFAAPLAQVGLRLQTYQALASITRLVSRLL